MRITWLVVTGLAIGSGSCEAPAARVEPVSRPIVAGALDTGDPAIMELLAFRGNLGARCTATLITPHLLIAAAHCIVETPGFQRFVFPGNDDRGVAEKDMLPIKTVVTNPLYGAPRQGNDFCIVVLQAPVAIRPIPLNRAALDGAQGKTVRYVGYGLTTVGNPNSGGIKRQNAAPLAQVSRLLLTIAPNAHGACEGDSGGPLLLDDGRGESIIGIGSFVDAPACLRNSYYQRVDTQLAWIDEQIQKYDPGDPTPRSDGGVNDAGPPATSDAGAPDARATPPPAPPPDARPPDVGGVPPTAPATPDAGADDLPRAPDGAPEPKPETKPTTRASGATGGCSYTGSAHGPRDSRAGALAGVLLALAWALGRRRRSCDAR